MHRIWQWIGYLRWRYSGDSPKARNEQRKVFMGFFNASAIGCLAGVLLDSAQTTSNFDIKSAIYVAFGGLMFLLLSYVIAGRMEQEA